MKKQKSAIVLLSSGLDSTVNLYRAKQEYQIRLALTLDYGQAAAIREIEMAKAICKKLKIDHKVLSLPWLKDWSSSALTNESKEIPSSGEVDIASQNQSMKTAKAVWVSNRNGLFINVAAVFADDQEADYIIVGFNKEEAQTFPDNSQDFIDATNQALKYSCRSEVKVKSFTIDQDKKEIFAMGKSIGVDYSLVWACYLGGESPCETCESCQRFLRAQAG